MIVSVCSHACIVTVQAVILVGWIGPMNVLRLVYTYLKAGYMCSV